MIKTARVYPYIKKGKWCIEVPVCTIKRLVQVKFLGIGQQYQHKYKNGNTEKRWKIVESLAPDDNSFWFILSAVVQDSMSDYNLAVKIDDKNICYEWLTLKDLKISCSRSCLKDLNILEIALIESEIENALGS